METQKNQSSGEKERVAFIHGKKKVMITSIGAATIGAAIGATIKDVKEIIRTKLVSQPDEQPESNDGKVPVEELVVEKESVTGNEPEPADIDVQEKEQVKEKNTEVNSDSDTPSEEDIREIAEDLTRGSQIDERDMEDVAGLLDFTHSTTISLPNGLETTGYIFSDDGLDLVLVDLDGDGVYEDVLADINGELLVCDIPVTLSDGTTIPYNELIARNHITDSDIEQIINTTGENNLAMTDTDRRMLENDNPEDDIIIMDDNQDHEESLTQQEEDELLKDILDDNTDKEFDENSSLEAFLSEDYVISEDFPVDGLPAEPEGADIVPEYAMGLDDDMIDDV